jgi:hypothetical protein
MATIKKRKIEIIVFERERVVTRASRIRCPVCLSDSEMLTTEQAAGLAQVHSSSISTWLAEGKAHGIETAGGQRRICRNSLFRAH